MPRIQRQTSGKRKRDIPPDPLRGWWQDYLRLKKTHPTRTRKPDVRNYDKNPVKRGNDYKFDFDEGDI